jgi:hypothetical protein
MQLDAGEQLLLAVNNANSGRVGEILSSVDKEEAKRLANLRDKMNNEPVAYTAIRKSGFLSYKALADSGANLEVYFGPNQAQHIAAIYGRDNIMEDIRARGIKPRQNLESFMPSTLAKKSKYKNFAEELKKQEKIPVGYSGMLRHGHDHTGRGTYGLIGNRNRTRRKV